MRTIALGGKAAVLALAALLAGCGGGGSGGGGGVNSTPTPAPTPNPTPTTGANSDLIPPLASESFVNDAATGQVSYGSGNSGTASASASAVTVNYNETSRTYTVSTSGRSQSFAPSNLQTDSASALVYVIPGATTSDSLTLTRIGIGQYRGTYVGLGFWQRTTTNGSTNSGTFDAFAYGAATGAAAVPRSGQGTYSFETLGVLAKFGITNPFNGSGTLAVNFGSNAYTLSANIQEVDQVLGNNIGNPIAMSGTGSLSGSGNSFSGSLSAPSAALSGGLQGRFYGPDVDEVGAAFYLNGTNGIYLAATGALIGRKSAGTSIPATGQLFFSVDPADTWRLFYTRNSSIGPDTDVLGPTIGVERNVQGFQFRRDGSGTYILSGGTDTANFTSATQTGSDGQFTKFKYTTTANPRTYELALFKAGAANSTIQLSYLGFGQWQTYYSDSHNDRTFLYGYKTDPALTPRTGSASYSGIAWGQGVGTSGTKNAFSLAGTATFNANFANSSIVSTINGTVTNITAGTSAALAPATFNGTISGSSFTAATAGGTPVNGQMQGAFYGSNVQEIGALFSLVDPTAVTGYTIVGAAVGKQ